MTIPKIPNFNDCAVISPERIACIKFSKTAVKNGLPVSTNIQDVTVQGWPADTPADNRVMVAITVGVAGSRE